LGDATLLAVQQVSHDRENSDDGNDILYFIAFLKSHTAVLTEAAQKGSYVIYGQSS
jgi:hypothetical protein